MLQHGYPGSNTPIKAPRTGRTPALPSNRYTAVAQLRALIACTTPLKRPAPSHTRTHTYYRKLLQCTNCHATCMHSKDGHCSQRCSGTAVAARGPALPPAALRLFKEERCFLWSFCSPPLTPPKASAATYIMKSFSAVHTRKGVLQVPCTTCKA